MPRSLPRPSPPQAELLTAIREHQATLAESVARVGSLKDELDGATGRVRSSEALLETVEAERDALEQRAAELSASLDEALREVREWHGVAVRLGSCRVPLPPFPLHSVCSLVTQGDELRAEKARKGAEAEDLRCVPQGCN